MVGDGTVAVQEVVSYYDLTLRTRRIAMISLSAQLALSATRVRLEVDTDPVLDTDVGGSPARLTDFVESLPPLGHVVGIVAHRTGRSL
jgi:hypothetical protein